MSDKIWDDAVAEGKAKIFDSLEKAIRRRIEIERSGSKAAVCQCGKVNSINCPIHGRKVCETIDDADGCPEYMRLHADWMRLRQRDQDHLNRELMNKQVKRALEIAEGYVRAAAFKEISEPPYEMGMAHKHLAEVHQALAGMK